MRFLLIPRSDEQIKIFAVLQVQQCDEDVLKSYLSDLTYRVDVWVVDESPVSEPDNGHNGSAKDLVFSVDVPLKEEPIVLARHLTENGGGQPLTLMWEVGISLHRPRFKVPQPSVVLVPSATVMPRKAANHAAEEDLRPFEPLEANVLEPMRTMSNLGDSGPPYLALSRLERVLPPPAPEEEKLPIRSVTARHYKVVPAAISRMRYTKVNTFAPKSSTIASLDVEIIPFVQLEATVEELDMSLKSGRAESLMPGFLPMQCRSGDCLTFLYKLQPASEIDLDYLSSPPLSLASSNTNIDVLSVKIRVKFELSSTCKPVVSMEWTTNVDFTQALNPAFGTPSQPIQRANRPASLPVIAAHSANPAPPPSIKASLQSALNTAPTRGISISFTAPGHPVHVGEAFAWQVLIVNHSQRAAKLAIIPLPRAPRTSNQAQYFARRHAPKSSTASFHPSERRHTQDGEDVDIAQAVVDENVVYALQHSHIMPPETDLMALTPELRIGPLRPGQCHECEIKMVAFEAGVFRVDAMRVVDLAREAEEGSGAPGVVTDIRELPDVVVSDSTQLEVQ